MKPWQNEHDKEPGMSTRTIVNRWTDAVIWIGEATSTRDALLKALAAGANLRDANLRDADLRGANLTDAYLRDDALSGKVGDYAGGACWRRARRQNRRVGRWRVVPVSGCRTSTRTMLSRWRTCASYGVRRDDFFAIVTFPLVVLAVAMGLVGILGEELMERLP